MQKMIAFITFESPWFRAGGIGAVMAQLPGAAQAIGKRRTVVITPFHNKSPKLNDLNLESIARVELKYRGDPVAVEVLTHTSGCPWFFLKVVDGSFFNGERHPYDVSKEDLLRNSLIFGVAAVKALPCLADYFGLPQPEVEWHLVAQDWEASTALLAFKSQDAAQGRLHLTLHNSYDEFATPENFASVGINPDLCPGDTILHRALLLCEQPVFTVSDQFALDFTQDLLQREVMAPQLQELLRNMDVLGVDNGPFVSLAPEAAHLQQAAHGDYAALKEWKAGSRCKALLALDAHHPTESAPLWGDRNQFRREADSLWFVMAGRDDPRQKGYDVAALAVEEYLAEHHGQAGCAQFLFFPSPGDEGLPGLRFMQALAERFPADVIAFPFLWGDGFKAALRGATYGLMPSLYEPFGMANEFYLAGGCVGIGRATGGNLEQIVPLRSSAACNRAVRSRAERYHALSSFPTGILFRERDRIASALDDWRAINDAQYRLGGEEPSRVTQRQGYFVFQEMANELRIAIEDGVRLYTQDPTLYYRMIAEGVAHIQRTFSWERAGQEYARKVR